MIVSDGVTYLRARQVYDRQIRNSIVLQSGMNAEDVRRAHVQKFSIGDYSASWAKGGNKSHSYRNLYEENIRCFVPNYDTLIAQTLMTIQSALLSRVRNTTQPLNILEVGPGTGGLTKPLAAWIDSLNRPALSSNSPPFIGNTTFVEKSSLMLKSLESTLKGTTSTHHVFREGAYNEQTLRKITSPQDFDLICGSLVLHDILEENPVELIGDFLEYSKRHLRKGGMLVFADFFVESPEEIIMYKEDMKRVGMSGAQVKNFIDLNMEMVNTVKQAHIRDAVAKLGLRFDYLQPVLSFTKELRPTKIMIVHYD